MRVDYQNLQDGERRRYWSHGRAWLRIGARWYERLWRQVSIEWTVPCGHCGWGVTFGDGDAGRGLGATFAVPFLVTLFINVEHAFPRRLFTYDFDRGDNRGIECYFSDWTFRYSLWVGTMASWSRRYPWCRWWRQG